MAEADTSANSGPANQDALSIEFLYYGSILKLIAPTLSNDADREAVTPWIKKLFRPEYQTSLLRNKRNRYLIALTINILNDEITGIFKSPPPDDTLQDTSGFKIEKNPVARWEMDKMWQETLLALPDDFQLFDCSVHDNKDLCKAEHRHDRLFDQEFQFFLYLTRPYAALLGPEDRTRVAAWLQTLCTIQGKEFCNAMRCIRNDYIMALASYLHDLRIVAPFNEYPPKDILKHLPDAIAETAQPITDPESPEVNEFLMNQPIPEDGAFCYVALTGDLVGSNI